MPITTRQNLIRQAVLKGRKDWLHYTIKQEKQLYALCEDAAQRIQAQIIKYQKEGKVPPGRLTALLGSQTNPRPDSIRGIMRELRPKMSGQIKSAMTQSVNFGMKSAMAGLYNVKGQLPPGIKVGVGSSFVGLDGVIRTYDVSKELYKDSVWAKINGDAMDALMRTQYGGITLSERVWDITWDVEKQIRNRVQTAVLLGESADKLARDIKKFLIHPDSRFHRVRKDGKLVLSRPAKRFHPGRGVYRSAFQNARRVARTEMARAYHEGIVRYANQKKWIKGYISRVGSDNPAPYDAEVNGKFFPKSDPPMIPYHPNCYSRDTEVYTKEGWKPIKDVGVGEYCLSLNPSSFDLEYVYVKDTVKYKQKNMVHFISRDFDVLVTPEHNMFCKRRERSWTKKREWEMVAAKDVLPESYFYRSSEWKGKNPPKAKLAGKIIDTDLYCRLMGWYLSEGSVTKRKNTNSWQIVIAQHNLEKREQLWKDLEGLPWKCNNFVSGVRIYDEDLGKYLMKFGKSHEKYVPYGIKTLSSRYIKEFLRCYNLGDGSVKKPKAYKNGKFRSELTYFTTSKRLADDIGELILKVGKRPSFLLRKDKGRNVKHKNGNYASNYNMWVVTECRGQQARFNPYSKNGLKRKAVEYNDMVYCVELPKWHTLYVRRNGKCTWAGNCMCHAELVLEDTPDKELDRAVSQEEFEKAGAA